MLLSNTGYKCTKFKTQSFITSWKQNRKLLIIDKFAIVHKEKMIFLFYKKLFRHLYKIFPKWLSKAIYVQYNGLKRRRNTFHLREFVLCYWLHHSTPFFSKMSLSKFIGSLRLGVHRAIYHEFLYQIAEAATQICS